MKRLRIGISEKNQHDYWEIVRAGIQTAADRLGVEVEIKAPPFENIDRQLADIEGFIDERVDGIAFVATNEEPFVPVVQKALAKGIPVICIDLDAPKSGRYLYVGTIAPVELGRIAGREMCKALPNGGRVAVQTGSFTAKGAMGKLKGFEEVAKAQGIEIVEILDDGEDVSKALQNARNLLKKYPRLDGMYGIYAYHGWCQAQAIKDLGINPRPKLIGFDMVPQTVAFLKEGLVDASIWIGEYYFGFYTVAYLANMARLGVKETLLMSGMDQDNYERNVLTLPVVVYTPENVSEFEDWCEHHRPYRFLGGFDDSSSLTRKA